MSTSHPSPPTTGEPKSKSPKLSGEMARAGKGVEEKKEEATGQLDVEMQAAQDLEKAGQASGEPVAPTYTNFDDISRMMAKHDEFVQSCRILQQLPKLFPNYNEEEATKFIVWLAQLPVAMHRPRTPITGGWKAAGEVMTCQWDEKLPSIFNKLITNNISSVPVLDQHRRYLGMIDHFGLVVHALKCFGILDVGEKAASLASIAKASADIDVPISEATVTSEAELKMAEAGAAGPEEGSKTIMAMGKPIWIKGGEKEFAGRGIWTGEGDKGDWGERWERQTFKHARACDVIAEEIPVLGGASGEGAQVMVGNVQLPSPRVEIMAPPLQQGSSTLFAFEMFARMGLHRAPILNSDRFCTGLVTDSMLISLLCQYGNQIPSFCSMPVRNMMQFLAPHRMVVVEEDVIVAKALSVMVHERVRGAAIVNKSGALVDVLSARDWRSIGRQGQDFQRLWMTVADYKQLSKQQFPSQAPKRAHYVTPEQTMGDVLKQMRDGSLHRTILCQEESGQPKPIAVITQRDVMRVLLIFLKQTLQGEIRVNIA